MPHILLRALLCPIILALGTPVLAADAALSVQKTQNPKVKVIQVGVAESSETIAGMGSIVCPRNLELGFDESGVVSEIFFEEGDEVKEGRLLAKMEESVLRAELQAMQAKLMAAHAEVNFRTFELTKKQGLFKKEAISETELQKAMTELDKAQAAVKLAEAEINFTEAKRKRRLLYAPISGIVAKRYVDVGSVIMPGQNKVLKLMQCNEIEADIELGERLYRMVEAGRSVAMEVDAVPGKVFQGRLIRVGPHIDEKNRTFTLRVRLSNPELVLRSGMFARSRIRVREENEPIWIPKKALLPTDDKRTVVYVVKDNIALKRSIVLGAMSQDSVQVVQGLTKGEAVIVEGQEGLSDLTEVSSELVSDDSFQGK
jgi:membrane fusion protein (multidrug efflux system)